MQVAEDTHVGRDQRVLAARSTGRALGVAKVKVPDRTTRATPDPPPGSFAAYLVACMDAEGLDGATLSRLTGPIQPVDSSTISNLRNGHAQPGIKLLRRLAPHLGKSLGELLIAADPTLTEEELGMVSRPLPPVLRQVQDRLASGVKQRYKDVLLEFVQDDVDRWDGMIKLIEEEKAESRRASR